MKVVIFNGSPRPKGNTKQMIRAAEILMQTFCRTGLYKDKRERL